MLTNPRPLILTISHLKRAGLLDNAGSGKWIDIGADVFIRSLTDHSLVVFVPRLQVSISKDFPLEDKRFWSCHHITFEFVKIKFGLRPYFICPFTDQICLKLVFYKGGVTSLSAFDLVKNDIELSKRAVQYEVRRAKLLKLDGRHRTSSEERDEQLKGLGSHRKRLSQDEQVLKYQSQLDQQRKRDQKKFLWESRPLSMTKGLDVGQGANQHRAFLEFMDLPDDWAEGVPPPLATSPRATPASIERYPELNINVLIEREMLDCDEVIGCRLGWPIEATQGKWIYIFIDGPRGGLPYIVARVEDESSNGTWQIIKVLSGPRSDRPRYMLCPISQIRCQRMYFRDGFFASREAHGLYNPSQRAQGDRLAAR